MRIRGSLENFSKINEYVNVIAEGIKTTLLLEDAALISYAMKTDFISFGMLQKTGLLKIVDDPLAYNFENKIWRDFTGVVISSPQSTRNKIFYISPFPQNMSFFLYDTEDLYFQGGLIVQFFIEKCFHCEFLWLLNQKNQVFLTDVWYMDHINLTGGIFNNLCSRIQLHFDKVSLSISGGSSFGAMLIPGYFLACTLEMRDSVMDITTGIAMRTMEYVSAKGEKNDEIVHAAGKIRLPIFDFLTVEAEIEKRIEDIPDFDSFWENGISFFSFRISGECDFDKMVKMESAAFYNLEYREEKSPGCFMQSGGVEFQIKVIDSAEISLSYQFKYSIVDYSHLLKLKNRFSADLFDFESIINFEFKERECLFKLMISIEMGNNQACAFLKIGTRNQLNINDPQLTIEKIISGLTSELGYRIDI